MDTKATNQITASLTLKVFHFQAPFQGRISVQLQHEIGHFFAKNIKIIHDTFKLKSCFFLVKKIKLYHIGQMWFITFIAHVVAATLLRLPEICSHNSTNTIPAPRNVKTHTLLIMILKILTIKLIPC